jgi:hypothetical protein
MTVATGGRGNVRVRAFTDENLNIREKALGSNYRRDQRQ